MFNKYPNESLATARSIPTVSERASPRRGVENAEKPKLRG